MISYTLYKVIHYGGIFLALAAVVAFLARVAAAGRGGAETADAGWRDDPWRRRAAIGHGVGLFLVLLGGFGMLARLDITEGLGLPGWIWAKLGIWGALALFYTLGKRNATTAGWLVIAAPILAILAGTIALTKPF